VIFAIHQMRAVLLPSPAFLTNHDGETPMKNFIRSSIAAAVLAGFGLTMFANASHAALGQTALGKCYDRVIAACNKKPDHAVLPCANSGLDQCDEEHSASISLPAADIDALRSSALRRANTR